MNDITMSDAGSAPFSRYAVKAGLFTDRPIRVIDIGARGGVDRRWKVYGEHVDVIGFEPDVAECKRLNGLAKRGSDRVGRQTFYPIAIDRDQRSRTMYIARNPGTSSFLCPDVKLLNRYYRFKNSEGNANDPMEIVATSVVETVDLDTFVRDNAIPYVDFVKIDTQGAELAILEGSENVLAKFVAGVVLEVMFTRVYVGQPLFSDLDDYMRGLGFILCDLQLFRWRRRAWAKAVRSDEFRRGQVVTGDALYFRDVSSEVLKRLPGSAEDCRVKVLKLASLAEVFDFPDISVELLQNARAEGILSVEETDMMTSLLIPKTEALALVRSTARKIIPAFARARARQLLFRLLYGDN